MNTILNRFVSEPLFDACAALLNQLHIIFNEVTRQPIPFESLYPQQLGKALQEVLTKVKSTYFIGTVDETSLSGSAETLSAEEVTARASEGRYTGMMIFAVELQNGATLTRSESATLTRGFNRIASAQPVILFIKQGTKLALSTCERSEYTQQWRDGEKLGKVSILRGINCNNPHRGHIDILNSIGDKAYPNYEELYKHWMEVFSSELLTKKFYSELSDWYAWAVQVARFPNDLTTSEDDEKYNHESCIRLITRLIFVWFLKQKHLIPEEFFDERYIKEHFIEEFNPHDRKNLLYNPEVSKYYRLILQNLFFAMLNCPIVEEGKDIANNRRFRGDSQKGYLRDGYNVNNLMRYKNEFRSGGADEFVQMANSHVPFLNGGLFDCLDKKPEKLYYDGFSERKESLEQLYVPDWLFFGDEVGQSIDLSQWYGDRKKKNVSARGIIDILKRYNFTIEENTPLDQEVSLDPELLGKAFENLLASYNPETKTSARKQTGSFYTPREIVQYMVDESLVAHLKRMCGEDLEPQYRALLSYSTEETTLDDTQRKSIMQAIYNCRILDPACGSGAFPMGVLQQMVHVLRQVDSTNEMWKDFMIDIAVEQSKLAYAEHEEEERKTRLADIEEAFNKSINDPDYARKLYLIEHCIYGVDIQPIAVQISKLRFFISLVVDQKPTNDAVHNFGIRPLPNLESKFVAANTLIPIEYDASFFENREDIRVYKKQLKELNHQIFLSKRNIDKQHLKDKIKKTRQALARAIEDTGFVSQGAAQKLANWDMFDQNISSPFFDSEWMFGVKGGFDIVIGNPPYFQVPKGIYSKKAFPYSEGKDIGKQNMYKLFTEYSYNCVKEEGVACMIVQSSLMCDMSSKRTRELLLRHSCLEQMIEFPKTAPTPEGQVFAGVCQGTCIFLFRKTPPQKHAFMLSVNNDCTTLSTMQKEMILQEALIEFYPEDYAIPLLKPLEFAILRKIKEKSQQLSVYIVDVSQGDLNLSTSSSEYSNKKTSVKLLRGAHVHDFYIDYNTDEFVKESFRREYVLKNNQHTYIVSQAITGMVDYRRIHCALTNKSEKYLFGHSVNKTLLKEEKLSYYIIGLLNSTLMDWTFRKTSTNNNCNGYELKQLPIIIAQNIKPIEKIVKDIMVAKEHNHFADTSDLERLLDNEVFSLYGIFDKERKIIEKNYRT